MASLYVRSFPHGIQSVWFVCIFMLLQGDREIGSLEHKPNEVSHRATASSTPWHKPNEAEITRTFLGGELYRWHGITPTADAKVDSVVSNSEAECQRIVPGMAIEKVDGTKLDKKKDAKESFQHAVDKAKEKEKFTMTFLVPKDMPKASDPEALTSGDVYKVNKLIAHEQTEQLKGLLKVDEATKVFEVKLKYVSTAGCSMLFTTDDPVDSKLEANERVAVPSSLKACFEKEEDDNPRDDDEVPVDSETKKEEQGPQPPEANPRTILIGDFAVEFPYDNKHMEIEVGKLQQKPTVEFWVGDRQHEAQQTRSLSPPPADLFTSAPDNRKIDDDKGIAPSVSVPSVSNKEDKEDAPSVSTNKEDKEDAPSVSTNKEDAPSVSMPFAKKKEESRRWPESRFFEEPYLGQADWKNVWYRLQTEDKDGTLTLRVKNGDQVIGAISFVLDVLQDEAKDQEKTLRTEQLPDRAGQVSFNYYFDRRAKEDCVKIAGDPVIYKESDASGVLECPATLGPTFLMPSLGEPTIGKCVCRPSYCLIGTVCTYIGSCEKTLWYTDYHESLNVAGFLRKDSTGKDALGLQCKFEDGQRVCPALGDSSAKDGLSCDAQRDFSCNCPRNTCLYEKKVDGSSAEKRAGVAPICLTGPAAHEWELADVAQHEARRNPGAKCVPAGGAPIEGDPCDHWLAQLEKFYCEAASRDEDKKCAWFDPIAEEVKRKLENELSGEDQDSLDTTLANYGVRVEAVAQKGKCIGGPKCDELEKSTADLGLDIDPEQCKQTAAEGAEDGSMCRWNSGEVMEEEFVHAVEDNLANQLASKTAKDFHPGQYVILTRELPMHDTVGEAETEAQLIPGGNEKRLLDKGTKVHVVEVCKDPVGQGPDGPYVRARVDKINPDAETPELVSGWISVKPSTKTVLFARPTQVFPLGNYAILAKKLYVTKGPDGDVIEELTKGTRVQVVEVASEIHRGEIRAEIDKTPMGQRGGWIPLRSADSPTLYAEPQAVLPPLRDASAQSALLFVQPPSHLPAEKGHESQHAPKNSSSSLVEVNAHSILLREKLHRAQALDPSNVNFENTMAKFGGQSESKKESPLKDGLNTLEKQIGEVKKNAYSVSERLDDAIQSYNNVVSKSMDIDREAMGLKQDNERQKDEWTMERNLPFDAYDRDGGKGKARTWKDREVYKTINPREGKWDLMKDIIRVKTAKVGGDLPSVPGYTSEELEKFAKG